VDKQLMQINLCFLWHMHQPDYTDNKGELYMPWVFLHSIRDYYDMPYMVSKFSNLKATFNLTPTLIRQILIYEKYGYKKDNFLKLLVKENNELNDEERSYILKICKSLQPKMIEQFFRLEEIIDKDRISNQEFIDLEVLFLLAWTGNYLRVNNEIIKNLIIKEKFFTEEDKLLLVNELVKFIPKILPFYKSLLEKKQISVSTTPYYHPILPLLLDMKNAVKSNEKTVITDNYFSLKDDALKHIDMSINLYEEIFEVKPSGFWPAEGAVDEESIKIYKDKGIKWIATDELILFKSLGDFDKKKLYDLYEFNDVFIGLEIDI
jgi:alpha-amylase/alpha-mannosidase (GH57 family)